MVYHSILKICFARMPVAEEGITERSDVIPLSIIPPDYQRLRDLHPFLHPKIKVGCVFDF